MKKATRSIFFHSSPRHSHHHHGHRRRSPSPSSSPSPAPPVYTFSATMMEENVSDAEEIITKWDPQGSSYAKITSLFHESREEARRFLRAVADLRRAMHFFVADSHVASTALLVRAQTLMQAAMRRLQKEFHQILCVSRHCLDPESSVSSSPTRSSHSLNSSSSLSDLEEEETRASPGSIGEVDCASAVAVADLRVIAECMVSSGYGKECVKVYKLVRRSIVDEGVYKLGFEKPSLVHVQKFDWDVLDVRIRSWLAASKAAVRTLFSGERALCDQVFAFSSSISESCFAEIAMEPAMQLLRFPELVASKKKTTPERIFRILDMYDCISELWPDLESTFSFQSTAAVRSQAASSLTKLGEAVRSSLVEFESAMQRDSSKAAVPGGGLHPLSRYVMNYVTFLADYSSALEDIYADYPLETPNPLPESFFDAIAPTSAPSSPSSRGGETPLLMSPVSARVGWLILGLLCKLDIRAELYREAALAYLFLTNNLRYVVRKVRSSSGLLELLGEEWVARHEARARGYASSYERLAWDNVLAAIPLDTAVVAKMDVQAAGERMRRFNEAFEKAYRAQAGWAVADGRIREELKLSIARKLIPAYRPFYERCRLLLRGEMVSPAAVRFAPEDLENYISDLFYGGGTGSSVSSTTNSSVSGGSSHGSCR
ncbi:hypothetical protein Taro_041288 [Colocasia esculenta]|uniref:Exocyst subunit Exo70 family protein n=1 Tax=Colocasia esculenta TaxID=4460 RepID=A0A843WWV8_COLES|nr:hypothetical protein [Colocasia esculenta]